MLGVHGPSPENSGDHAAQLARVVCGTVLAGELALLSGSVSAADNLVNDHLINDYLVRSHMRCNRYVSMWYSITDLSFITLQHVV